MTPRLLDLFCGAGGAAMGYHRAGFEVVGVDIKPQPRYPFEFVQADALEFLDFYDVTVDLACLGFNAIHASPPCQAHSTVGKQRRAMSPGHYDHPDLVAPTRELLQAAGLPYVIENVEHAPLLQPVLICGSSVGLPLKRHRLFETSFPVLVAPCSHGGYTKRFRVWRHGEYMTTAFVPVYGTGGGKASEHWADAMGIDWMRRDELAEAIPPAYTELIGHQLMQHLQVAA